MIRQDHQNKSDGAEHDASDLSAPDVNAQDTHHEKQRAENVKGQNKHHGHKPGQNRQYGTPANTLKGFNKNIGNTDPNRVLQGQNQSGEHRFDLQIQRFRRIYFLFRLSMYF